MRASVDRKVAGPPHYPKVLVVYPTSYPLNTTEQENGTS